MKKLLIVLGVVGVSLSAPLVRISSAPSMVLVLYRVSIAAVLLLPAVLIRQRGELRALKRRDLLLCFVSGLFLGLHFACYFESLRFTSIASAVALVDTEVFFVALMALVFFRERIPWLAWLGILITFAGSIIISVSDAGGGTNRLLGDGIALTGAACMAVYTIIGKICRRRMGTTVYTFPVYVSAAITVSVILLISGTPVSGYEPINWLTALGMAVFCTLLGHSVFSWGLRFESAAFVSTVKLLEPVFASMLGFLLFREIPTLPVIVGGTIVILGVVIYTRFCEYKPKAAEEADRQDNSQG